MLNFTLMQGVLLLCAMPALLIFFAFNYRNKQALLTGKKISNKSLYLLPIKPTGIPAPIRQFAIIILCVMSFSAAQAQNAIVTENALPGNPISEWGVPSFRDDFCNGYATDMSVDKGQTIHFKINLKIAGTYTLKIYRLGYYGGNGARLKADLGTLTGVTQPQPALNHLTGIYDCSAWSESAHWDVPANAVSGFYIAKIVNANGSNHILFIVRDDASHSDLLLQSPDANWQAYNGYGGSNLYNGVTDTFPGGQPIPAGHALKVSYNRPFFIYNANFAVDHRGSDWYMNDSYPMIRWIERNGYDVTYTSSVDVAQSGALIKNHRVFINAGHDEYWSEEQRTHVREARDAGVNLAFFTANEVYWKTRWENDNTGKPFRTIVCYKEGLLADGTQGEASCGGKCDGTSAEWTGQWRSGGAFDAGLPENALTGQMSWQESFNTSIQVPASYKHLRFWRNTAVASLGAGQIDTVGISTLGYEWDWEQAQFHDTYPNGRITMSSTTINGQTHKLALYKHSSGAWVFGAGTIQWMWGLDDQHFGGPTDGRVNAVSLEIQQATLNLFADMGVQPGTKQSDLVAATASTDVTAPTSVITSPASGNMNLNGAITISGTSSDLNVVAGVEVSVDGGVTWKIASGTNNTTGTSNWTFNWIPPGPGTFVIKARGYDDSGNMEAPGSSGPNVITLVLAPAVCPCHIFTTQTPVAHTDNDGTSLEMGVKFRSSVDGFISGVRFYKTTGNTGVHIGELYTRAGVRLAQATFTAETSTGWQDATFSSPVAVTAGTTYIAAYFSSDGFYVEDNGYFFDDSVHNSPLTALMAGDDGENGIYKYSATPVFPDDVFAQANYWVDVTFLSTNSSLPVELIGFTALTQGHDVQLKWTTASEQNNKGFEIQRSKDGLNWNAIGFVNGAGNSQSTLNYQYIDKSPGTGKFYYRLRQVDIDGRFKISQIAVVNFSDRLALELLQNHPNPFNSLTTIDISVPQSGRIKLTLYDQMGRPVKQLMDEVKNPGSYQVTMNRSGLSAGIYYYKLESKDQSIIKKMTVL